MAASDLIARLKRAQAEIQAAARDAKEALAEGDLSLKDQVEVGQALWRISNEAQGAVAPIKDSLREEALERQKGLPGRQFLAGRSRGSRCTVVVPPPTVKIRVTDINELRTMLGRDFDTFFRLTVSPHPDFSARAAERPDLIRDLARIVDTVSGPPRVTFND